MTGITQHFSRSGIGELLQLPHPGAEQIVETDCDFAARSWAHMSLDYQWVKNPGHNTDRGPASIVAVSQHAPFQAAQDSGIKP